MEIRKEIYEVGNGYGYKIFVNGKLTILQPHYPCLAGTEPMTQDVANDLAEFLKIKLERGSNFKITKDVVEGIRDKTLTVEQAIINVFGE